MPALDLWPLLEMLQIRTKGARTIPLQRDDPFAWAQRGLVAEVERQYNEGRPVRIIVLKARQLGISTIVEAILFLWCFLHPGSYNLVLSKEQDDSEYLYTMTKRYWELGPMKSLYETQYYSKQQITFHTPPGSTVKVGTANKEEVGRGMTVHGCHGSEVSRWGDFTDTIIPGLQEAMPDEHGTIWILESTANGVGGYFYDTWQAAVAGESDFIPMFFPWFFHPEYEIAGHHLHYSDLDDEEEALVEHMLRHGVDHERVLGKLAWRRKKIAGFPRGIDQFHEEHPTTPTEAFLTTGSNVFPLEQLDACYDPTVGVSHGFLFTGNGKLEFVESGGGHLTVYKFPDRFKRQRYVVAVDPSWTLTGDPACIQVLNRATLEQVAVWRAQSDPQTVGEIALQLGYFYNTAMLNSEIQGGGRAVVQVWRDHHYRQLWMDRRPDVISKAKNTIGWSTTRTSKEQMIGMTKGAIIRRQVLLHHPGTHYEMSQYIALETGTYGPARRSGHDDCVMAYMLAVVTCLTESESLDWHEVTGTARGEVTPAGARGLTIPGQGHLVDHIGPYSLRPEPDPLYYGAGEIDEWIG